ncbi:tail assembly protein [soil metagenome]
MTGSPMRYSPSTGGFYHVAIHGTIPADAVVITSRCHRELLAGQAEGRRIFAGSDGEPAISPVVKPRKAQLLAVAIADIKREARSRILAIASLERQANDNAAIALRALAGPGDPLSAFDLAEFSSAITRRRRIDAVRSAGNALEHRISNWATGALSTFEAGADAFWPKE